MARETSMIKYVHKATDRKHECYIYLRALSIILLINNSVIVPAHFEASKMVN